MASQTDICNMALSHIGNAKEISLITDHSKEANACLRYYDTCIAAVLRDFKWPFATRTAPLGLITPNPTTEWNYSYQVPADCLRAIRVLSLMRNDTRQSRVPFKIEYSPSGQVIYTDMTNAVLEYTANVPSTAIYPPDFALAASFRLGIYLCPRLTAGDPFKIKNDLMNMYKIELATARVNAANEGQEEELPDSEFIRARG